MPAKSPWLLYIMRLSIGSQSGAAKLVIHSIAVFLAAQSLEGSMRWLRLSGPVLSVVVLLAALCVAASMAAAQGQSKPGTETKSQSCSNEDSVLKLLAGICAIVFAD